MTHLTCPQLDLIENISHGFFTRQGGVSQGLYSSLNLGIGSDDSKNHVLENRNIVQDILGGNSLHTLYQIHSNKVVIADENSSNVEADAFVTDKKNIIIGILTADCVPVLFADPVKNIIGAAHAGWKGAISGIIENTVEKMVSLGAKTENIIASIGPCISADSYEVSAEFYENFIGDDGHNINFFEPSAKSGHYMFDIAGYVKSRISKYGVININNINRDTYKESELFYSYRRSCHNNEPDYGRQISAICLK